MFTSLDDLKKKAKKDEKKDDKSTESYSGGEKSGLAVSRRDDPLDALMEKAKQGGRDHAAEGKDGAPKTELRITLWSNGFQVDGGEFRDYDSPNNKQFMKELHDGYVPKEL